MSPRASKLALTLLCSVAGPTAAAFTNGQTIGAYVPNDAILAGSTWPGDDPASSNAAWNNGKQPDRFDAWPQTGYNTDAFIPQPCWKYTVLNDVAKGWNGQCEGGTRDDDLTTASACQAMCLKEPKCSWWNWQPSAAPGAPAPCQYGVNGVNCGSGNGDQPAGLPPLLVTAGQRVAHGDVRVLKDLTGFTVDGLYSTQFGSGNLTQSAQITRCKGICYSTLGCSYWLYSQQAGCQLDMPALTTNGQKDSTNQVQYPLTTSGFRQDPTIMAGEYIQHYCPPQPTLGSSSSSSSHSTISALSQHLSNASGGSAVAFIGILVGLILLAAIIAGFVIYCYNSSGPEKRKGRRGISMPQYEEEPHPDHMELEELLQDQPQQQARRQPQAPAALQAPQPRMQATEYKLGSIQGASTAPPLTGPPPQWSQAVTNPVLQHRTMAHPTGAPAGYAGPSGYSYQHGALPTVSAYSHPYAPPAPLYPHLGYGQ